jgi:hypothetical protein
MASVLCRDAHAHGARRSGKFLFELQRRVDLSDPHGTERIEVAHPTRTNPLAWLRITRLDRAALADSTSNAT